jgi:Ca-activated chloride channel family protein
MLLAVLLPGLARAAQPVPYAAMDNGGLFFPAEVAGYVVPATTVAADVDIAVNGLIARTTVRQRFENPTDEWVEGVYVFPLPETASVDRLRMIIGDRVVEGVIEEREAAERRYEEAREAGQQASLVSQERPNIFTNAVANIPPRDSIVVEIEYQQSLTYEHGAVGLRFPTVVLPRYVPGEPVSRGPQEGGRVPDTDQVTDASRITPPVADPAFGPVNPVALTVTLDAGFPVAAVDSPSHPIAVTPGPDGRLTVAPTEEAVFADRDFVLSWRAEPAEAPTAAVFSETLDGHDYHLVMLVPPETGLPADKRPPREVVFIIDTSGSMAGDSIVQAREALLFGLSGLGPEDSFQIIAFNDVPTPLFAAPQPATGEALAAARRFVRSLVAENGTEMRAALEMALDGAAAPGRLRQVVFMTDGAVGNEAALFGLIHDRLGDSRLFTVGIGSAPNSHFMREAAEAGRGTFTYIGATDAVRDTMTRLFSRLENPALTDIAVTWPDDGPAAMYPPVIPDLYVGEPVLATVRLPQGTAGQVAVAGRRGTEGWQAGLTLSADRAQATGVAALWARDRIVDLERQLYRGADGERIRRQILDVALSHGLVSQYTSLVAIDDEVVRPPEADLDRQAVATNMPEGVDMDLASALPDGRRASLEAIRNMARFGSPQPVTLPMGATGAPVDLLIGLACLVLAALLLVLAGRVPRAARYRL